MSVREEEKRKNKLASKKITVFLTELTLELHVHKQTGGAKLKKTFCHSPYGLDISMYFGFGEYSWTALMRYKT